MIGDIVVISSVNKTTVCVVHRICLLLYSGVGVGGGCILLSRDPDHMCIVCGFKPCH